MSFFITSLAMKNIDIGMIANQIAEYEETYDEIPTIFVNKKTLDMIYSNTGSLPKMNKCPRVFAEGGTLVIEQYPRYNVQINEDLKDGEIQLI